MALMELYGMKKLAKPTDLSLLNIEKPMRIVNVAKICGILTLSASILVVAGCASKPVIENRQSRYLVIPQYYTVKPGDTLSKIAMRYNLDYREVARLNNIGDDYIIYTNQSLRLHDFPNQGLRTTVKATATPVAAGITSQTLPVTTSQSTRPTAYNSSVKSTSIPSNSRTPSTMTPITTATPVVSNINWTWPADGAIIEQFNPAQDIKGLRIGGKVGDTVRAAADGEVVYASDRLPEYGNLVLIRHSVGGYVTAYAHNSKILVSENQQVKAGQKIAEMGATGSNRTMLEFQIRLNGKPINPISLLPAR